MSYTIAIAPFELVSFVLPPLVFPPKILLLWFCLPLLLLFTPFIKPIDQWLTMIKMLCWDCLRLKSQIYANDFISLLAPVTVNLLARAEVHGSVVTEIRNYVQRFHGQAHLKFLLYTPDGQCWMLQCLAKKVPN